MPSPEQLRKLAVLAVKSGVGLMPGQELVVRADISDVDFVRLIVEEAYKAGAKSVSVFYGDEKATLLRFEHGNQDAIAYSPGWLPEGLAKCMDEGGALLSIASANPALLKDVDPEKISVSSKAAAMASTALMEKVSGSVCNWSIVPVASPAWAKMVFPGVSEDEAVEKLWDAIFHTTRADAEDPAQAWADHCVRVQKTMDRMNQGAYTTLHLRAPGTDLKVGLAENNVWEGVLMHAKNGATCSPNIPTEEIFSMPHRSRVDGHVSSTKPLSLRGTIVEGIKMTFKDGVAIEASAEKGDEALQKLLASDEGARRLGEIALVPHSSPISQSGLTFFNTLFDENASCHIAMGRCYASNMKGYDDLSADEKLERGANDSLIHVDWMIGSGELEVDGTKADGTVEPLMRNGEWV